MKKIKIRKYPNLGWYYLDIETTNQVLNYMTSSAAYFNITNVENTIVKSLNQL